MESRQQCLLIDLDGVVYQEGSVIDGAQEALDWLVEAGIPHMFVTNTTSCSRCQLLEKLKSLGISCDQDKILTPAIGACDWLKRRGMNSAALFIRDSAMEDFSGIVPHAGEGRVDAVVLGDLGEAWNYDALNRAFRLLMQQPGPELIALGLTRYWRADDGLRLDVAAFVKGLEYAADCEARVFGKPAAAFFESALMHLNCSADQALMLGDDIAADIAAAQACGIRGLQVKTGKFRDSDLTGSIEPFAILDSIAELPVFWQQRLPATP